MKFIKDFLVVSRANIQIASLPTATLGLVLASRAWKDLLDLSVLLYIILFFTILTYSCNLNCLHDLDVDKKHKSYMSSAVTSIGVSKLKIIITIELILAGVIIILLCILKSDPIYLFAFFGILCGYIYSAPPFRIKKRGILSPFPVMFGLYFLPIIAGWFIITESLSLFIIIFGLGYAMIMEGITFINTCEDYEEDKTFGIRTLAHIIGIRKTLFLGTIFVSLGGFIDLYIILLYKVLPNTTKIFSSFAVLIISLFFLVSIVRISARLYSVSKSNNPMSLSKKEATKMRYWFLITRYPLLFISLFLIAQ